jgi:hypothetical protein
MTQALYAHMNNNKKNVSWTVCVAQVVEYLPHKGKALNSIPSSIYIYIYTYMYIYMYIYVYVNMCIQYIDR